jgi:hypothetical protein
MLTLLFAIPLNGVGITAWAGSEDVEINETNFPDDVFREFVASEFDENEDGFLSANEIEGFTYIDVREKGISDLTGIEYFSSLYELNCNYNQLTFLDVSKNSKLYCLYCSDNQLTTLDVSNNRDLMKLDCSGNQLTSLDLSNNSNLYDLNCSNNSYNIGTIPSNKTITLSEYLPKDFDTTKASGWTGASYDSSTGKLTVADSGTNTITYTYDTSCTSNFVLPSVTFTLTYEEFENPLTGDGTSESPYQISTAEDLIEFSEMINKGLVSGDVNAMLTYDIDFGTDDESGGGYLVNSRPLERRIIPTLVLLMVTDTRFPT